MSLDPFDRLRAVEMFFRTCKSVCRGWSERRLVGAGVALDESFLRKALQNGSLKRALLDVDRRRFLVKEVKVPTKDLPPCWSVVFPSIHLNLEGFDFEEDLQIKKPFGILFHTAVCTEVGLLHNASVCTYSSDSLVYVGSYFDLGKTKKDLEEIGIDKEPLVISIANE